jgi:hypothetical protein
VAARGAAAAHRPAQAATSAAAARGIGPNVLTLGSNGAIKQLWGG